MGVFHDHQLRAIFCGRALVTPVVTTHSLTTLSITRDKRHQPINYNRSIYFSEVLLTTGNGTKPM
jgi:hypothetical protein